MIKGNATNQFSQGLVMDLNPLLTPNTVLTDALNATIYTNNGNEGVLQNDMGNGRVETAYLPEGYIPVGSCEFGDIIYIASYNPLINKCQLGCFPSPQRNISSSSISDLKQSLQASDFQKFKGNELTGYLKQSAVKKIVYQNNLTAGDKYIVAAENVTNSDNFVSDLGNTDHTKDNFPRLYRIKLVSIEENGKLTELTSGLKWYNTETGKDFFLKDCNINRESETKPDIDEWRSAVNSAYCIFSSKVSGKLALLVELESITGFSCSWGVTIVDEQPKTANISTLSSIMPIVESAGKWVTVTWIDGDGKVTFVNTETGGWSQSSSSGSSTGILQPGCYYYYIDPANENYIVESVTIDGTLYSYEERPEQICIEDDADGGKIDIIINFKYIGTDPLVTVNFDSGIMAVTANGTRYTSSGKNFAVPAGTSISWSSEFRNGYEESSGCSGTQVINENFVINAISKEKSRKRTVTVNFDSGISKVTVNNTDYTTSGSSFEVDDGTSISWESTFNYGYEAKANCSGTTTVTGQNYTINAQSQQASQGTTYHTVTVYFDNGISKVSIGDSFCTISGSTLQVADGTSLTWSSVFKDGYEASSGCSGTKNITSNFTINAISKAVEEASRQYTVQVNFSSGISKVTVNGKDYTTSGQKFQVPKGTVITWSSTFKSGYEASSGCSGTVEINSNYTIKATAKSTTTAPDIPKTDPDDIQSSTTGKGFNIYFLINWETENNNINPAGIVLREGKWIGESTDIKLYELTDTIREKGSFSFANINSNLAYPEDDDNFAFKSNYYYAPISRIYAPENNIDYDTFKSTYEYDTAVKAILNKVIQDNDAYPEGVEFKKITRVNTSEGDKYYLNLDKITYDEDGAPKYLTLVKDTETERFDYKKINPVSTITDDIINNTFSQSIKKNFAAFDLPTFQEFTVDGETYKKELDLSNCIYKYKIAPYMPYGILKEYEQEGIIDFSKIGKKIINLNTYKYYNQEGYSTFTWGLEAYTEENRVISEVVFEFMDNGGLAAALHVSGKESYNGVFTNYLTFGTKGTLNLTDKGADGTTFKHRGLDLSIEELEGVASKEYGIYNIDTGDVTEWSETSIFGSLKAKGDNYCENDAGILYANMLYFVKITIKYCEIDALGNYVEHDDWNEIDYRWFWTTTQFNDLYYQLQDFKNAQFTLGLDPEIQIKLKEDSWDVVTDDKTFIEQPNQFNVEDLTNLKDFATLSAISQTVDSQDSNINIKVSSGLQDSYNAFALKQGKEGSEESDGIGLINTTFYLGQESTTNSPSQPAVKYSGEAVTKSPQELQPVNEILDNGDFIIIEKPDNNEKVNSYHNKFYFDFVTPGEEVEDDYYDANLDLQKTKSKQDTSLYKAYSEGFDLKFIGQHFSKYYYDLNTETRDGKILKSFLYDAEDWNYYHLDPKTRTFNKCMSINEHDKGGQGARYGMSTLDIAVEKGEYMNYTGISGYRDNDNQYERGDDPIQYDALWREVGEVIKSTFHFIFPVIWTRVWSWAKGDPILYNGDSSKILGRGDFIDDNDVRHRAITYVGTCACISESGLLQLQDQNKFEGTLSSTNTMIYISDTSPVKFGIATSSLLQHCFYVAGSTQITVAKPSNWIYLEDNYSQYNRDMVVLLDSKNKQKGGDYNDNNCILFHSWDYSEYLNKVIQINEVSEDMVNSPNINLKLNSCQKTFPFTIQFQYIKGDFSYKVNTEYDVLINDSYAEGLKKTIENFASTNTLDPNKPYCVHYNANGDGPFVNQLSGSCYFPLFPFSGQFNLSNDFASKLLINNGRLYLSSPLVAMGTYNIRMQPKADRWIYDYNGKDILIFNKF